MKAVRNYSVLAPRSNDNKLNDNKSKGFTSVSLKKPEVVEKSIICFRCTGQHDVIKQDLPEQITISGLDTTKFNQYYQIAISNCIDKYIGVLAAIGGYISGLAPIDLIGNIVEISKIGCEFIYDAIDFSIDIECNYFHEPKDTLANIAMIARIMGQSLVYCPEFKERFRGIFDACTKYLEYKKHKENKEKQVQPIQKNLKPVEKPVETISMEFIRKYANENMSLCIYNLNEYNMLNIPEEEMWDYLDSDQYYNSVKKLYEQGVFITVSQQPKKEVILQEKLREQPEIKEKPKKVIEENKPITAEQHSRKLAQNYGKVQGGRRGGSSKTSSKDFILSDKHNTFADYVKSLPYAKNIVVGRVLSHEKGSRTCNVILSNLSKIDVEVTEHQKLLLNNSDNGKAAKKGVKEDSVFVALISSEVKKGIFEYSIEKMLTKLSREEIGEYYFELPSLFERGDFTTSEDSEDNIGEEINIDDL